MPRCCWRTSFCPEEGQHILAERRVLPGPSGRSAQGRARLRHSLARGRAGTVRGPGEAQQVQRKLAENLRDDVPVSETNSAWTRWGSIRDGSCLKARRRTTSSLRGAPEGPCDLAAGGGAGGDPPHPDRSAGHLPPEHQPARDAPRRLARSVHAALLRGAVCRTFLSAKPLQHHHLQLRLRRDRDRDRHGAGADRGADQHARPQSGVLRSDPVARRSAYSLHRRMAPAARSLGAGQRHGRADHAAAAGHQRLLDVGHDPDRRASASFRSPSS